MARLGDRNTGKHNTGKDKLSCRPDQFGHYGEFGGRYVPEVLIPALEELASHFERAKKDLKFLNALRTAQETFIGRPTPLYHCENLSRSLKGAQIYVKNEGLAHTGAHKINHCLGQALLAQRMKKKRIIAETGAGQHGLATAAVCAKFGLEAIIYMGAIDVARQRPNVFWMERLGAKVVPVKFGGRRLKDAVNAALKDWITNVQNSHYLLGSCVGPHPFPEINRYFQSVVGREIRQQMKKFTGRTPDYVIACVGGGSNALGAFDEFLSQTKVQLIGVEAGGRGQARGQHASRFREKRIGVVEGFKSYWLLDEEGQVADTHSISAGLDYAGVGPLHAYLAQQKRVQYVAASDKQALDAVQTLAQLEGIIPALESAHALAHAIRLAPKLSRTKTIVVNLSGRGDKDLFILAKHLGTGRKSGGDAEFFRFLQDYCAKQQ